jgi:hypothetical protein
MTENFLSVLKKRAVVEKKDELLTSLVTNSSYSISSDREKRLGEQMMTMSSSEKKNIGAARRSIFLSNRLSQLYKSLITRLNELMIVLNTKQHSFHQSDFYDIHDYGVETYLTKTIFRCPANKKDNFNPSIFFYGNTDILSNSSSNYPSDEMLLVEHPSAWKITNFDNDIYTVLEPQFSKEDIGLFSFQNFMTNNSSKKTEKMLEMIVFYIKVLQERFSVVQTELNGVLGVMISLEAQSELVKTFTDSTRVDETDIIEAVQLCSSMKPSNDSCGAI